MNQLNLIPEKDNECNVLPAEVAKLGQKWLESSLVAKVFSSKAVNRDTF